MDALARLAFRWSYRAARLWWHVRRPAHEGAVVAVWHEGRVLMLRHSYRESLGWPGGSVERNETPRKAARRELFEELRLDVPEESLSLALEMTALHEHRRDHVHVFEVTLRASPHLAPDNREVVEARFMTPEAVLAAPVAPFVEGYLADIVARRP